MTRTGSGLAIKHVDQESSDSIFERGRALELNHLRVAYKLQLVYV